MKVKVLLFASFREVVGTSQSTLDVRQGATLNDVWSALVAQHPRLEPHTGTAAFAINGEYARPTQPAAEGDEIAFLPPVSGG
jgi:molybdopterin converting factor subunit 1